jgi:hypothetical protein
MLDNDKVSIATESVGKYYVAGCNRAYGGPGRSCEIDSVMMLPRFFGDRMLTNTEAT